MSTVTILLAIVLSALHLENDDLVALNERIDNFTNNFSTVYSRCSNLYSTFLVDTQYLAELNSLTLCRILDVVNEELLALLSLELLTVNFYNCVHLFIVKRLFRKAIRFVRMLFHGLHGLNRLQNY